jgi:fatty acid desaturase|tara:strand:+ start:1455 stop:2741 length:1287 start_codon:yes stop_codon:yes gene_type:complete
MKRFTNTDLSKSITHGDRLLIVIDDRVHDVSGWVNSHPGGSSLLRRYRGRDASDVFHAFHGPEVTKKLRAFDVGGVGDGVGDGDEFDPDTSSSTARETTAFRALRDELWNEGAFKSNACAVLGQLARMLLILGIAMWLTFVWREWVVLGAAALGLFWQQSLLLAHDACHRSVTRHTSVDKKLGSVLGTLIGGVGAGWWNQEHCEHHACTQVIGPEGDPSAGSEPVLCPHVSMTQKLSRRARFFVNFQAFYYVPICVFVGRVNLHVISIIKAPSGEKALDTLLMFGYVLYNAALLLAVDGSRARVAFFVVSNATCGVLHLILNMNHYPMPMLEFGDAVSMGFLRFQCTTTLNIEAGFFAWYYGGLELQIEHHLFPLMPRDYLPKISQRVKKLCMDHDVPYTVASGFWNANGKVLKTLNDVVKRDADGVR